ncbi:MAG: hypothetical protein WC718_14165, partial [Phycisphaerales bacterium]
MAFLRTYAACTGLSFMAAAAVVVPVVALSGIAAAAQADDFVSQANRLYADISPNRRSDVVVLPVVAKMDAPPRSLSSLDLAAITPASSGVFKEFAAWASSSKQQDVLTALATVTKAKDWRDAYAFGQPYGADDITPDLVRAKLYTELGDPATLAGAQFLYLPALDKVMWLVNAEATRLAADGKPNDAIDVLINGVFFCRQISDREFAKESLWGMQHASQLLERIRDVAYVASLSTDQKLKEDVLITQINRLDEKSGYLDISRIHFPRADRIAGQQVLERVYSPSGELNERVFAPTLARLGATDHPLRLFSEAARWKTVASQQTTKSLNQDKLNGMFDDWASRWTIEWLDPRNRLPTVYSQFGADRSKMAAVNASVWDEAALFDARQIFRVESAGTRTALSVLGVEMVRKSFPPQIQAIRPRFMEALDVDPYNPNRANGARPPLEYFVPMRDTQG